MKRLYLVRVEDRGMKREEFKNRKIEKMKKKKNTDRSYFSFLIDEYFAQKSAILRKPQIGCEKAHRNKITGKYNKQHTLNQEKKRRRILN